MHRLAIGFFAASALAACAAPPAATPSTPPPSNQPPVQTANASSPPAATVAAVSAPAIETRTQLEPSAPRDAEAPVQKPAPSPAPAIATESDDPVRKAAKDAIDRGDYAHARELVEQLIVGSRLQQGIALLADGEARDALAILEDVQRDAPGRVDAMMPFAEASLRVGIELGETVLVERALNVFALRTDDPAAMFGASRAALVLGRSEDCLRFARAGVKLIDDRGTRLRTSEAPERTYLNATLAAYRAASAAQSAKAPNLRAETENAFARALGARSTDASIWAQLGDLYASDGQLDQARGAFEHALDRSPNDATLLDSLWRVCARAGGDERVLAAFEKFRALHAEVSRAAYLSAHARFALSMEKLASNSPDPSDALRSAEADFRRARELEPSIADDCSRWEALCRNALARCRLAAGDLAGARTLFESTEECFVGGMKHSLDGKLESSVRGLEVVAQKLHETGDVAGAASIFERLRAYQPDDASAASSAGYLELELGNQLDVTSKALESASKVPPEDAARLAELRKAANVDPKLFGTDDERRAFERSAREIAARAHDKYEAAYAAYAAAAELAPDDVRVVTDTAAVLVLHLGRDWDRAKQLLEHAVEVGARQLANPALSTHDANLLKNAWGDAHENLGALALDHEHDPAAARKWFQRAFEIGPDPRPKVKDYWLKKCDEADPKH